MRWNVRSSGAGEGCLCLRQWTHSYQKPRWKSLCSKKGSVKGDVPWIVRYQFSFPFHRHHHAGSRERLRRLQHFPSPANCYFLSTLSRCFLFPPSLPDSPFELNPAATRFSIWRDTCLSPTRSFALLRKTYINIGGGSTECLTIQLGRSTSDISAAVPRSSAG